MKVRQVHRNRITAYWNTRQEAQRPEGTTHRASSSLAAAKEARMALRATLAVLEGAEWLTVDKVASLAGLTEHSAAAQLHQWRLDGEIFAINRKGSDYFPGYALNPKSEFRPYHAMKHVILLLGVSKDGWGLAYWFQSINSFLGGMRPMDVLAKNPDAVIAAAADEVIGVVHA